MRDTPTILAALYYAECVLEAHALRPGSNMLTGHTATEHAATLRTLRSQIEKERPFLEAAMANCAVVELWAAIYAEVGATSEANVRELWERSRVAREKMQSAYRSLISEKPPEEGAK